MAKKAKRKTDSDTKDFFDEESDIQDEDEEEYETPGRLKRWRERHKKHGYAWHSVFGFFGPFVGAIAGMLFLVIGLGLLNFFNGSLSISFVAHITQFFSANLKLFLAALLFFGYGDYTARRIPAGWLVLKPLLFIIKVVFLIWILVSIFWPA